MTKNLHFINKPARHVGLSGLVCFAQAGHKELLLVFMLSPALGASVFPLQHKQCVENLGLHQLTFGEVDTLYIMAF